MKVVLDVDEEDYKVVEPDAVAEAKAEQVIYFAHL